MTFMAHVITKESMLLSITKDVLVSIYLHDTWTKAEKGPLLPIGTFLSAFLEASFHPLN